MKLPKLTKLELQIMEALWTRGPCAIREIQEAFPKRKRPAYSTIQTTVYRLEVKRTLRRIKKISHAHIFEASISRGEAQGRLIDDLLSLLGDRLQPVMAHLIESRKLTLGDVKDAEKALLALKEQDEREGEAMIPGLFAHLWQSTLFAAGAWLAALWLRANRAHVRYWVWFMASVKFLIPFSLLVGLGTLTPHHAAGTRPEQNGWPRCRN